MMDLVSTRSRPDIYVGEVRVRQPPIICTPMGRGERCVSRQLGPDMVASVRRRTVRLRYDMYYRFRPASVSIVHY